MIKLVAFDWNGTLLADTNIWWRAACKEWVYLGREPITLKQLQKTFTIPLIDCFVANGFKKEEIQEKKDQITYIFHKHFNPAEATAHTRGGSRQILKWLKNKRIEAVIYSNHFTADINTQLKRLKINKYITTVIGRHEDEMTRHFSLKQKEERLTQLLKIRNITASEVVTVGDTDEEIKIGQALGLHTVALTGGYFTTSRLKACKPDFLIHNLKDLIPIIEKLNNQ